jgi:hypothetical protein
MKNRTVMFMSIVLLSLVLSGCGPGQILGPTFTPSPTFTIPPPPTITLTPIPTMLPSYGQYFDDPECKAIDGASKLEDLLLGAWRNPSNLEYHTYDIFCTKGKLIRLHGSDNPEITSYTLNGNILRIANSDADWIINITSDILIVQIQAKDVSIVMRYTRYKVMK